MKVLLQKPILLMAVLCLPLWFVYGNFILAAVSLDPFNAQEAHFELPLWELGLPDDAATQGEDFMNGHRWTWYGKTQWTRLEPQMPFGIWRITVS